MWNSRRKYPISQEEIRHKEKELNIDTLKIGEHINYTLIDKVKGKGQVLKIDNENKLLTLRLENKLDYFIKVPNLEDVEVTDSKEVMSKEMIRTLKILHSPYLDTVPIFWEYLQEKFKKELKEHKIKKKHVTFFMKNKLYDL
jgi:hypothetical protein